MAFYDYYCELNQRTVEVYHPMSIRLRTWGEVCEHAKIKLGKTPADTPVVRLIDKAMPIVFRLKGLDKDDYGGKLRV